MNKQEMRAAMKALLRGVPPEDLSGRSRHVAERLAATRAWKEARTILCFLSMPHEISTEPIIEIARGQGKTLAVPRIEGDDITFLRMPADAGALPRDRWDIPIPDTSWEPLDLAGCGPALVTSPGLAFDREGNRLGRGKGYYDRFLITARRQVRDLTTLGVCLAEQVLSAVPHEDYDQPLDGLVTDTETILLERVRP